MRSLQQKSGSILCCPYVPLIFNRLSANSTKFDHFVGFELEGLKEKWLRAISSSFLYRYAEVLWKVSKISKA